MRRALALAAIAVVCVACAKQDYSDPSDAAKAQTQTTAPKVSSDGTVKGTSQHKGLMVPQQAPPNGAGTGQPPAPPAQH